MMARAIVPRRGAAQALDAVSVKLNTGTTGKRQAKKTPGRLSDECVRSGLLLQHIQGLSIEVSDC